MITKVHKTSLLSELVCSKSFRSHDKVYNVFGVLHERLRLSNSLIIKSEDQNKISAISALTVDRK